MREALESLLIAARSRSLHYEPVAFSIVTRHPRQNYYGLGVALIILELASVTKQYVPNYWTSPTKSKILFLGLGYFLGSGGASGLSEQREDSA
jgi:hypothetical protein